MSNVNCKHDTGVMIPQTDLKGNYIKPEFMICTDCRLVFNPTSPNSKSVVGKT